MFSKCIANFLIIKFKKNLYQKCSFLSQSAGGLRPCLCPCDTVGNQRQSKQTGAGVYMSSQGVVSGIEV